MNNNKNPFLSKEQVKSSNSQGNNFKNRPNQNRPNKQNYQPNKQNGSGQYFERPMKMRFKSFNLFPSGLYLASMIFCVFFFIIWLLTFLVTGGFSIDLLLKQTKPSDVIVNTTYVIAIASGVLFLLNLWLLLIWVLRFKKNQVSDFNFVMNIVLCVFTGNIFLLFIGLTFCISVRSRKKQYVQENLPNNVKNSNKKIN